MAIDPFHELQQAELPPPPRQLRSGALQRVNVLLVALHLMDFLVRGIPAAALQFAQAVGGFIGYCLSGRYGENRKDHFGTGGKHHP